MKITRPRIASLLALSLSAQMLLGCASLWPSIPEFTPAPGMIESPDQAYAGAQATIDAGERQLLDLSRKATEVSLNMAEAADDAAQATRDYNERQKMELDFQSTVVSLNIAQAAATQEFIKQETKNAGDATAAAQSSAVAATQSAHRLNVTQTAQAQAIVDAQVEQTAQAVAALTAYPLTATPFAVTQAALLMQQYDREQQSFVDKVVAPLIPIIATLDVLLITLGIVMAYRRFIMPMPWPRRLRLARVNVSPIPLMIDGVIVDHESRLHRAIPAVLTPANPPGLPGENANCVEIIDAAEPPVAHWIAEVEQLLAAGRGRNL